MRSQVHWTKVADLVHQRKVFLEFGQAYVPSSQELSLVVAEFTARLTRNLEVRILPPYPNYR